jgi:diguanylate cyclase (GGDEF)-like protein
MHEAPPRTKLIIADDEHSARVLLTHQLENAGYEVIACADGRSALNAMRELGSGIIITDWQMPEIEGVELCRMIRAQCEMKGLGLVYYILLTAHSDKEKIVQGFEAGADDYLTKPYHPQELLARIRAGERILALQNELIQGRFEVNKVNAQMAVLNARLEKLANTDTLTGLSNRRYVLERAGDAWALAERNGAELGCIMLDIDRFKSINDAYGHHAGDLVLQYVASVLKRILRRYDICGRFGGEEFVIFSPSTPLAGVVALAERIRTAIAAEAAPLGGGQAARVTLSCGAAIRRVGDASPEALIHRADELLYHAKENGRNQVWYVNDAGRAGRLTIAEEAEAAAPASSR